MTAAGIGVCALGVATYRHRQRTIGQRREAQRLRQAADRAKVDAILRREQLAPRFWHATVVPDEQQPITLKQGDRPC